MEIHIVYRLVNYLDGVYVEEEDFNDEEEDGDDEGDDDENEDNNGKF